MIQPAKKMRHEFVTYIPEELDDGVVYASMQYRVAVHRCPCGCGDRVVTPLDPAQWALTYDGQSVSLAPSIGGGSCNSHYYITRGRVRWYKPLTERERLVAAERDQAALKDRYEPPPDPELPTPTASDGWWSTVWRRIRGRS